MASLSTRFWIIAAKTLASLSTRFWIIAAREAILEWEKECAMCQSSSTNNGTATFEQINYILKSICKGGSRFWWSIYDSTRKGYLCLFTCLASRAVHLEMAYGLDVDSFLNALNRMINRRGVPEEILSDNGTNFVAANKELCEIICKDPKVQANTTSKGIKWTFNPPYAPHFGGVFEIMIKSAKRAITAILKNADVKDEELMTAFCGAEASINSRPLTNIPISQCQR